MFVAFTLKLFGDVGVTFLVGAETFPLAVTCVRTELHMHLVAFIEDEIGIDHVFLKPGRLWKQRIIGKFRKIAALFDDVLDM